MNLNCCVAYCNNASSLADLCHVEIWVVAASWSAPLGIIWPEPVCESKKMCDGTAEHAEHSAILLVVDERREDTYELRTIR